MEKTETKFGGFPPVREIPRSTWQRAILRVCEHGSAARALISAEKNGEGEADMLVCLKALADSAPKIG